MEEHMPLKTGDFYWRLPYVQDSVHILSFVPCKATCTCMGNADDFTDNEEEKIPDVEAFEILLNLLNTWKLAVLLESLLEGTTYEAKHAEVDPYSEHPDYS